MKTIQPSELKIGDSILFDASVTPCIFQRVTKVEMQDSDYIVTTEQGNELCIYGENEATIEG